MHLNNHVKLYMRLFSLHFIGTVSQRFLRHTTLLMVFLMVFYKKTSVYLIVIRIVGCYSVVSFTTILRPHLRMWPFPFVQNRVLAGQ